MQNGVKIRYISKKSPFFKSGLRHGDYIIGINGEDISDELDFRFYAAADFLDITAYRKGTPFQVTVLRDEGSFIDLDFYEQKINRCQNHCVFCFIDQMPRGLRSGLYIKDEDFKHSFLNGNYVTLSGASLKDLQKVSNLGISPLYISVHATDTIVRNTMLGNRKAPPIMEQLSFLQKSGVFFHTQIVVCKGYNDGKILRKTIQDLFSFGESLLSIAVVPVGLTKFRKKPLEPIDMHTASKICALVEPLSGEHAQRDGIRKLFLADELLIKAGKAIPDRKYYEQYPQIENGVGLVRQLFEEWKLCRKKLSEFTIKSGRKNSLIVTSVSAYPFVEKIIIEAKKRFPSLQMDVTTIVNEFFGELVTVAGLLTAADVIRAVKKKLKENGFNQLILPGVMFNYAGYTLDGFSARRISDILKVKVKVAASLEELFG